jgi:hypothetical protein
VQRSRAALSAAAGSLRSMRRTPVRSGEPSSERIQSAVPSVDALSMRNSSCETRSFPGTKRGSASTAPAGSSRA